MYENILRMVNSYRFTYGDMKATHHERFSFRPYMKDGKLIPLEPHVFSSLDNLYKAAEDAFAKDFWAKPKAQFPYSVAFIKALSSHAFTIPLTMRWERQKRHEFLSQYKDPYLGKNLLQVITWFSEWAAENNITPVVFFVPMNKFDITSPQIWIDTYKDRLPGNLIIRNVDFSRIKPNNYNLSTGRRHPTPYGADALAAQIVDIVQPLVLP